MRIFLGTTISAVLVALALGALAPATANAAAANDAVLAEINFARANPQAYALSLLLQPVSTWERALGPTGPATDAVARTEAIDFLMRQAPLPPLRADDNLAAAALEHVTEQGPIGATGHNSLTGERFDARLRRYGVEAELAAENIAYGPTEAGDVVRELIIDSGVPSRGHRRNIFLTQAQYAGVSCGPHRDYGVMCVIDFAGRPLETAGWRQTTAEMMRPSAGGPRYRLFNGVD